MIKSIDAKSVANEDGYTSKFNDKVYPQLKMWDKITNYPTICVTAGPEDTEYLAARDRMKQLTVNIRAFVKDSEGSQTKLELILSDIETMIESNSGFTYTDLNGDTHRVTDCSIESINTDEGVLDPLGIGEMVLTIKYL